MTDIVWPATFAFLLALSFCSALASYSLRGFSRSRLEELCDKADKPGRFSNILKRHEQVLLAVELLHVPAVLGVMFCILHWLAEGTAIPANPASWLLLGAEAVLIVLVLIITWVVFPWSVARVAGEPFLVRVWPTLSTVNALMSPAIVLAGQIDKFLHRLTGRKESQQGDAATLSEEIRTVVDEGQREGILESGARTMIHRVIELQHEDVAAIMTPRTDMVTIPVGVSLEAARVILLEAGHSRVPVIGNSTDDVIGILYAKDLLNHVTADEENSAQLRDIVREPFYVPETTGTDKLLEMMQRRRVHLAIVLDEYGGVAGLVSMEDILEEIVGEIVDEYDTAQAERIHRIQPGVTEVDARVHIDDLNEQFSYELPEDGDFDTIGGFVCAELGRVPETGESLTWRQLRITILQADKRKTNTLRIEVDPSLATAMAEEG